MIAALPMYDRPETRAANDRLWQLTREALGYGPEALTRGGDLWGIWQSPELLLAQTCGFPYRARLHGHVTLIGTPDYGEEGCPPGYYRSALVVRLGDSRERLEDFSDATLALNEPLSQSGWAAAYFEAEAAGFAFSRTYQTGGHIASAQAVAEGHADIAAIDSLTWRMIMWYDGFAAKLRVLRLTTPTPTLPYITAPAGPRAALFDALSAAIDALEPQERDTIGIKGLIRIPAETYLNVPTPPAPC